MINIYKFIKKIGAFEEGEKKLKFNILYSS